MKRNIIFDLDGTLADGAHRQHHIDKNPRDWDAYYREAAGDLPVEAIVELFHALLHEGYDMHIISGRRNDTRKETVEWLNLHGCFYRNLVMRDVGDRTQDNELKILMAKSLNLSPSNVLLVFEDRARCVKAWREAGYTCLQVAPGDF